MAGRFLRAGVFASLAMLGPTVASAQTNITPTTQVVVTAANDWATRSFQDPIDMNQNTDLGWFIFDVTNEGSIGWTSPSFITDPASTSNRLFSGTATYGFNSNVYMLETGNPVSARLGRTGDNYSINTTTYRTVALRMKLPGTQDVQRGSSSRFIWYTNSIYDSSPNVSNAPPHYGGWGIYIIDLPTLGASAGTTWTAAGTVRTLRFDPTSNAGDAVQLDWMRLVPQEAPTTITWTGSSGPYDLHLDTRGTPCDGDLGPIIKTSGTSAYTTSTSLSGNSFTFQATALEPGDYVVAMKPIGGLTWTCSAGYFRVNAPPTLAFMSPSEEGSSDDFATVQLNNAWDMNATSDIDEIGCTSGAAIATLTGAERPDGASLGNVQVFSGTSLTPGSAATGPSCAGAGDPALFYLWPGGFGRGATYKIDTDRYRILTLEMGLPGGRNLHPTAGGSVARLYWRDAGAPNLINASQDIIINHRAGANVIDKITADMSQLPLEPDGATATNWTGQLDYFRVDPHEFTVATDFWVKQVKLAALERPISNVYTIRWTYADTLVHSVAAVPTLTLKYDTDNNPSNGTGVNITTGINPGTTTSFPWDTTGLTPGDYYIYADYSDGLNSNGNYARWPIRVEPYTVKPRIVLNRSRVNFAGTSAGALKSSAQEVRLSVVGSGTVSWTASVEPVGGGPTWVQVSPASGTGSATLTISIKDIGIDNNLVGDWVVKVSSLDASNSPQYVRVYLKMYQPGNLTRPTGSFDSPTPLAAGGVPHSGSIVVGGWVTDDLEVLAVEVYRDRVDASDSPATPLPAGHPATGKIYMATAEIVKTRPFGPDTALFVDDARTDIAGLFPASPWQYRAGWGYLMLTWGLPNQGTGTYTLYAYAFDRDGAYPTSYSSLGTRTFTSDNRGTTSSAQKPFGALDAPYPGETVSGVKLTGGWALTQPSSCRVSKVWVGIDSGPLQAVSYGDLKPGFDQFFPTNPFTDSPYCGAAFFLDTSAYANGVHQIGYLVEDNCGHQEGIGSRFFSIFNASGGASTAKPALERLADSSTVFPMLGLERSAVTFSNAVTPVTVIRGFPEVPGWRGTKTENAEPGLDGVRRVRVDPTERVAVHVGNAEGSTYSAYRVLEGRLSMLPVGSSFDARKGIFYWQPGPGYLGEYDFVVLKSGIAKKTLQWRVKFVVGPETAPDILAQSR